MLFRNKKCIRHYEQYRLICSVEKAREDWKSLKGWRIICTDAGQAEIPGILAEVRYRYLLSQARKRRWDNCWYMDA